MTPVHFIHIRDPLQNNNIVFAERRMSNDIKYVEIHKRVYIPLRSERREINHGGVSVNTCKTSQQ